MTNLDDIQQINKIDTKDMARSIIFLKDQVKSAWGESKNLKLPVDYGEVNNIVLVGMGGSALGPHIIRSVYDLPVPFQIVHDYTLPSFVNENSLVIVSSYSGMTEEVLSALKDAEKKKAKIVGIASGGVLIEQLKGKNLPFYQIDTQYNPSGNPRLGVGFSIAGILGMLSNLGFVKVSSEDIEEALKKIDEMNTIFNLESKTNDNSAKQKATELMNKIFTIVSGPFLEGNAHTFANQTNESAKSFGGYFILSELNHHLLEGITYPETLKKTVKFFNLESDLYEEKIKMRMQIGTDLLRKNGIPVSSYRVASDRKDLAAFETLAFSSWASYYMAIGYGVDPNKIPNVDFFKDELTKKG